MDVSEIISTLGTVKGRITERQIASRNLSRLLESAGIGVEREGPEYTYISAEKIRDRAKMRLALKHNLREDYAENADKTVEEPLGYFGGAKTVKRGMERTEAALAKPIEIVKNYYTKRFGAPIGSEWCFRGKADWDRATFDAFAKDCMKFLVEEKAYPKEAIISAVAHYDETVRHMQVTTVDIYYRPSPQGLRQVREGRKDPSTVKMQKALSRAHYVGERKSDMAKLQDEFWQYLGPKYGLERPLSLEETGAKKLTGAEWQQVVQKIMKAARENDAANIDLQIWAETTLGTVTGAFEDKQRELEDMKRQLEAGLGNQREVIQLLWAEERRKIAKEREEEKKKARAEAQAELAAEREALARVKAENEAAAAENTRKAQALEADRAAHEAAVKNAGPLIAQAAEVAKDKAFVEAHRAAAEQVAADKAFVTKHMADATKIAGERSDLEEARKTFDAAMRGKLQLSKKTLDGAIEVLKFRDEVAAPLVRMLQSLQHLMTTEQIKEADKSVIGLNTGFAKARQVQRDRAELEKPIPSPAQLQVQAKARREVQWVRERS